MKTFLETIQHIKIVSKDYFVKLLLPLGPIVKIEMHTFLAFSDLLLVSVQYFTDGFMEHILPLV